MATRSKLNSRLDQALNWENKKKGVRNQEKQTEKKMRNAYNRLRSRGNTTVNPKNIVNAFRKYPEMNVNHYLKNFSSIKHFSRPKTMTLKQKVESRKLNDLPTRLNDLESRVSSLEKILQRARI